MTTNAVLSPAFPSRVTGGGGVTVAQSGGITQLGFDMAQSELGAELQTAIDAAAASVTTAEAAQAAAEAAAAAAAADAASLAGIGTRGIFTVSDYISGGGSDITSALKLARNAAVSAGGGTLWIPPGLWTATSASPESAWSQSVTCLIPSNVMVEGAPGSVIDFQTTTNNSCVFMGAGASTVQSTTTTIAASRNDESITVASVTGLAVGDLLSISGNDTNAFFHFWVGKVRDITGNVVTFWDNLPWYWAIGADVNKINGAYVQGGGYKNLHIKGTNAVAANVVGIADQWVRDRLFQNLILEGFSGTTPVSGQSAGLSTFGGYQNRAYNVHTIQGGTAATDDIALWWQSHLIADDLRAEASIGFGVGFNSCVEAQIGRVSAYGKSTNGRGVKFGGAIDCVVQSVQSNNSRAVGLALAYGSSFNSFGQVMMRGNPSSPFSGGGAKGLWLSDQDNTNNTFSYVQSQYWLDFDIEFGSSDAQNYITAARVTAGAGSVNNASTGSTVNIII